MTMEARTDTQTPQATRLEDYRPPDWCIGTVELEFELGEDATRVRARMAIRRDHEGPARPLVLDGQGLATLSLAIDGRALGEGHYVMAGDRLTGWAAGWPGKCPPRASGRWGW